MVQLCTAAEILSVKEYLCTDSCIENRILRMSGTNQHILQYYKDKGESSMSFILISPGKVQKMNPRFHFGVPPGTPTLRATLPSRSASASTVILGSRIPWFPKVFKHSVHFSTRGRGGMSPRQDSPSKSSLSSFALLFAQQFAELSA